MNILILAGLSDKKLISKIEPLVVSDLVSNIYLIRRIPLNYEKVINYNPPSFLTHNRFLIDIYRFLTMIYVLFTKKINLIMGIYVYYHGIISFIGSKLFNKKLIINIIGNDLHKIEKSKYLQIFIKDIDIILTRGSKTKKRIIKFGIIDDIVFSPPNVFVFDKNYERVDNYKYDLLYVGYFAGYKRLDILIDVVKELVYNYKLHDIKVALVGDGALKEQLLRQIKNYNLNNNFEIFNFQTDLNYFYKNSKIFIMTSEAEGLPMVSIEALSYGLPCILPDESDITDVAIHNYNSLLAKPLDTNEFVKYSHSLLTNQDLYNYLKIGAMKFREEHENEYSLKNITNIWNQIFEKLGLVDEENSK